MKKKVLLCIVVALVFLILCFFVPFINVLSITNRKNKTERIYNTEAYKSGFCISYTHSVNKGRVHDYYICDKKSGDLIMTQTHFVSYGAGIPEPEETEGANFQVLDNGYLITNINRQVPKLLMAVGVIANHTFAEANYDTAKIGEPLNEIPLKEYFAPQTSLIFKYKKISFFELITHKNI